MKSAPLVKIIEPYEVACWTKALGVTRDELARAMVQVGNSAEAVRAYFQRGAH